MSLRGYSALSMLYHISYLEMSDRRTTLKTAVLLFVPVALLYQAFNSFRNSSHTVRLHHERVESWCPIPAPIVPDIAGHLRPSSDFAKDEAIDIQVQRLSAAVRVATESWDNNGEVDVDPRWDVFGEFHRVLRVHFPKVYGTWLPGFRSLRSSYFIH